MPRFTLPALDSPAAQAAISAATAAATTLVRPARFPRWVRRGVAPYVTKQIQASTARLQEKALPKETLESTLSDPLGTKQKSSAPAGQIESANTSRPAAGDDDERSESDEHTDH